AVVTTRGDLPDPQTIVLGPNLLAPHHLPLAPGAILYNLAQAGAAPWFEKTVMDLFRRHPTWDYSERNARNIEALDLPRPRVVPIGWAPELERIAPVSEDIDVLFYGSFNARRSHVLDELRGAGARVEAVCGVYGPQRDALIARSKIVLNVHYFDSKVFEIVRVSYLLSNGRAVVSERGAAPEEEMPFEEAVAFADYDGLTRACLELLQKPKERARLSEAGRRVMRARPETAYLKEALWASALA
ncbi:MAG: glycosyltransferase, partial [Myxococcales bacterium]|nr:glycosyltransferase [Myxococcales bacterium]